MSVFLLQHLSQFAFFSLYLLILSIQIVESENETMHASAGRKKCHQFFCRGKLAPLAADGPKCLSFASQGATSSRTGRRVDLHVRKQQLVCSPRQFWHFSISCYDHRRCNIHLFLNANGKKTQILIYLMWKYFISACTGPIFKNTPGREF